MGDIKLHPKHIFFFKLLGAAIIATSLTIGFSSLAAGPIITSVAPTTLGIGSTLTITGTGFAATGNTVRVGNGYIDQVSSTAGGTSIAVNLPALLPTCPARSRCTTTFALRPGKMLVSVQSGSQTSATKEITIGTVPEILRLQPLFATVGTRLQIVGSGFAETGNSVLVDGGFIATAASRATTDGSAGRLIEVTLPAQRCPGITTCTSDKVTINPGPHSLTVLNSRGQSASVLLTTVGVPIIDSVEPSSAPVGATVVIRGKGFTDTGNRVTLNGRNYENQSAVDNGSTIRFTIPVVTPGEYQMIVNNAFGTSESEALTVSPPAVKLSLRVEGAGQASVTSAPTGVNCAMAPNGRTCEVNFPQGSNITLQPQVMSGTGTVFLGWGGSCSGTGSCVVTMTGARAVTARFGVQARLQLGISGAGAGTISVSDANGVAGFTCKIGVSCERTYQANTNVTLQANAAVNSVFSNWTGNVPANCLATATTPAPATCTVKLDSAKTIGVNFVLKPVGLTIKTNSATLGIVTTADAKISCGLLCKNNYPAGMTVELRATYLGSTTKVAWSGCTVTADPKVCRVVLDQARSVIATFGK